MTQIQIQHLSKTYDRTDDEPVHVFDDLSVDISEESFTTIMGPSGCGKSTLLNILAGLTPPTNGEIRVDGNQIVPGDLSYAYVFQEPRLLNWRTVGQNIKFALYAQDVPEEEHDSTIDESLAMVGLADERDSYPLRLSGGMRQRVGIARALAVEPEVLLMDEPFGSLDEITARQLRRDLIDLWQRTGKTIVYVTHDISEAVFLSERIICLNDAGQVFHEEEIEIPHPRDFDSDELIRIEKQLTVDFFDNIRGIEK